MAVSNSQYFHLSSDLKAYEAALASDPKGTVRIASKPSDEYKKVNVASKLSVWESNDGKTVAGKKCFHLLNFTGYASFYVEAKHTPASYTVYFKNGLAKYAVRTCKREGKEKVAYLIAIHPGESTRQQLVSYLNHNLTNYFNQRAHLKGTAEIKQPQTESKNEEPLQTDANEKTDQNTNQSDAEKPSELTKVKKNEEEVKEDVLEALYESNAKTDETDETDEKMDFHSEPCPQTSKSFGFLKKKWSLLKD